MFSQEFKKEVVRFIIDLAQLDSRVVVLVVLIVLATIIIDGALSVSKKKKQKVGLGNEKEAVSIDGSKTLPIKNYVSDMQGLAGKPDAVISENGFLIPVERKPLAKKMRDRYVAQLLVYMRLVEEFEGKKPPYGYLILGPQCRTFKIPNSSERQAWLQKMLDSMRGILDGMPAKPLPDKRKCDKCFIREYCDFKIE